MIKRKKSSLTLMRERCERLKKENEHLWNRNTYWREKFNKLSEITIEIEKIFPHSYFSVTYTCNNTDGVITEFKDIIYSFNPKIIINELENKFVNFKLKDIKKLT